jgi:hypothetical protein
MQYTVVHSKDPYLLARLATDLQMDGYQEEEMFESNPFITCEKWMAIHETPSFYTMGHNGMGNPIRHELTSRNYIKVLTQILQP